MPALVDQHGVEQRAHAIVAAAGEVVAVAFELPAPAQLAAMNEGQEPHLAQRLEQRLLVGADEAEGRQRVLLLQLARA